MTPPPEPTAAATTRAKTRVLMTLLACFAVWPLVQHALVVAYDVSPWHYCGFAMYCVPRPRLKVDVESDGRPVDARIRPRIMPWLVAYADRRQAMGELAAPDSVAGAVFAVAPDLTSFDIVVTTFAFDGASASFIKKERRYAYAHKR